VQLQHRTAARLAQDGRRVTSRAIRRLDPARHARRNRHEYVAWTQVCATPETTREPPKAARNLPPMRGLVQ